VEPSELEAAKQALRSFAVANGMDWLLDELDEAVAVGVVAVKSLRQASRKGEQVYEEVPASAPSARGRKRAEEFLTRRPMTDQEQVEALIGALRRVLVDLDDVARVAVEQLNGLPVVDAQAGSEQTDPDGGESSQEPPTILTFVEEIDFVPDEGSVAASVSTEGLRHSEDRSTTVGPILDGLLAEVRR
jgi:hypothetical protein